MMLSELLRVCLYENTNPGTAVVTLLLKGKSLTHILALSLFKASQYNLRRVRVRDAPVRLHLYLALFHTQRKVRVLEEAVPGPGYLYKVIHVQVHIP